ncbi:enoyl-CoA hydratase-related protein [Pseudoramibacter sp. HA2172]|uniref:enoyl-CoA hydratase-related protein n=1 Tax=Pseudoramibacter faecis TaxID=3108534 RepID=UPI002E77605D|nr:enoyl-CoA hydratase-related protein [Pseudoramibacter sp. HA2172]
MKEYHFFKQNQNNKILTIKISRLEALNALSTEVVTELGQLIDDVSKMIDDVWVVIFTGDGDKSFVAGGDIKEMYVKNPDEAVAYAQLGQSVLYKIENMPQPTIAAVNGFALGGGTELAMAFDIRIASNKAVFGQPETGLGIIPGFAGTQRLPRLVSKSDAKWLIFSSDRINAEEALRIGLVSRVVPHEQLMNEAMKMAKKIASNSPYAVRLAKKSINQGLEMDFWSGNIYERHVFGLCFTNEDQVEGMRAFIDKDKVTFTGNALSKGKQ